MPRPGFARFRVSPPAFLQCNYANGADFGQVDGGTQVAIQRTSHPNASRQEMD
jgi:hypothetical protein